MKTKDGVDFSIGMSLWMQCVSTEMEFYDPCEIKTEIFKHFISDPYVVVKAAFRTPNGNHQYRIPDLYSSRASALTDLLEEMAAFKLQLDRRINTVCKELGILI